MTRGVCNALRVVSACNAPSRGRRSAASVRCITSSHQLRAGTLVGSGRAEIAACKGTRRATSVADVPAVS